jgi:hypothetical protein
MSPDTFAYHAPNDEQQKQLEAVLASFNTTLAAIEANVPEGRYRSIAITELEKAGAMAVKGIFKANDGSRLVPAATA